MLFQLIFCLSKISKNSQIIGYIQFYGNNYKIGNDKTGFANTFAILIANPTTSNQSFSKLLNTIKSFQPYQKPHFATIFDIWYCRISHISFLSLHILGKNCLGIWLRDKKMSQCIYYIMSKIFQQVLQWSPVSQSTEFFYRVYIDWLDLENNWNSY